MAASRRAFILTLVVVLVFVAGVPLLVAGIVLKAQSSASSDDVPKAVRDAINEYNAAIATYDRIDGQRIVGSWMPAHTEIAGTNIVAMQNQQSIIQDDFGGFSSPPYGAVPFPLRPKYALHREQRRSGLRQR